MTLAQLENAVKRLREIAESDGHNSGEIRVQSIGFSRDIDYPDISISGVFAAIQFPE